MKCETCNKQIGTPIGEIIKVKELGIEVQRDVIQKNTTFKDIVIPKGWRLMTYIEVVELANSEYAKDLKMDGSSSTDDFFIEQPFKINKNNNFVAWFGAGSGGAFLICVRDPQDSYSGLGVRFVRDLKRKTK